MISRTFSFAALLLLFNVAPVFADGGGWSDVSPAKPVLRLCDALAAIGPGESRDVFVRGVYGVGPESSVLFDEGCQLNVQPVTWVEFSDAVRGREQLNAVLLDHAQAVVVFHGVLYGPDRPAGNAIRSDRGATISAAFNSRYGHLNGYRTKLVVQEICVVKGVEAGSSGDVSFWAPPITVSLPAVIRGDIPEYPSSAQHADVSGVVNMELTVVDGAVTSVKVLSGHDALASAAVMNVKTWKFTKWISTTIRTVFVYALESRELSADQNSRIELQLPSRVTITAAEYKW